MSVEVLTNHFPISNALQLNRQFYQYRPFEGVTEEPRDTTRRTEIVRRMQTTSYPHIFSSRAFYDGRTLFYSSQPLNLSSDSFQVNMSDNPIPRPSAIKTVTFQPTSGAINLNAISNYVQTRNETNDSIAATTVMQLIIRASANENFVSNGKSYFTSGSAKRLPGGLELWKGFFQSVRPVIGKVLINVDTTVGIMVRSGPVIDVAMEFLRVRDARDLNLSRNSRQIRELEKFLKRKLIQVPGRKRPQMIRALEPQAGRYRFAKDDGSESTVGDHFQQVHNLRLRFPDIIGINTSGKNSEHPAIIPLECCKLIEGQFHKGKVPDEALLIIIKSAAMRPEDRRRIIEQGIERENYPNPIQTYRKSEYVIEAGLDVSDRLALVRGHILRPPAIVYGERNEVSPRDGGWNYLGKKLYTPTQLEHWAAVNFNMRTNEREFHNIVKGLAQACSEIGMRVGQPTILNGNMSQPVEAFMRAHRENPNIQMFVVLLPTQAEDTRNAIKHWGDTIAGVLTQCMRDKGKPFNDQYYKNVALKINARLGGYNSITNSPMIGRLKTTPYIIMGADVSHSAAGSIRPSIAGLVYSMDTNATKYEATTRIQRPRMERIEELKFMVFKGLLAFCNANTVVPTRLIFYRDGLSEGEFEGVGQAEVNEIREAIAHLMEHPNSAGKPTPKLTYIIVGKRHHVVFFPKDRDRTTSDNKGNVQAGFATSEGLSNPSKLDFYLQSHKAIQGTARSAHYTVLQDENFDFQPQPLQELSYALCHVYAKATRSVSIPAPVYYADLVCSRSKFHFGAEMGSDASETGSTFDLAQYQQNFSALHNNMTKKMYFL